MKSVYPCRLPFWTCLMLTENISTRNSYLTMYSTDWFGESYVLMGTKLKYVLAWEWRGDPFLGPASISLYRLSWLCPTNICLWRWTTGVSWLCSHCDALLSKWVYQYKPWGCLLDNSFYFLIIGVCILCFFLFFTVTSLLPSSSSSFWSSIPSLCNKARGSGRCNSVISLILF